MPERPADSTDAMSPNEARAKAGEPAIHDVTRTLLDVFVYAPIGFLKRANTLVPELIRDGRATAQSAKTIGAFVTPVLKRQGEKIVREQFGGSRARPSTNRASPAPAATSPNSATTSTASAPQAAGRTNPAGPGDPAASVEPFEGFDRLGAAAVVARLEELTQAQRAVVRRYERANRNRRTVLGRLDQLDASGN